MGIGQEVRLCWPPLPLLSLLLLPLCCPERLDGSRSIPWTTHTHAEMHIFIKKHLVQLFLFACMHVQMHTSADQ